jgi:flavin-dependent dehydrogenase
MEKKSGKAVIVGSSIAGSMLALLLGKAGIGTIVIEERARSQIGKKVCANIVTSSFLASVEKIGINPKTFLDKKFSIAEFYSANNSIKIPVEDYEVNRKKLLEEIIKKAENLGVKFYFDTRCIRIKKIGGSYNILTKRGSKLREARADYIIGCDGALSDTAKSEGLWQDRKFWLAIQTKVNIGKLKRIKVKLSHYYIFFMPKFGHYSYIFPSKKYLIVGTVANPKSAIKDFRRFASFLKIGRCKKESALIPIPKRIRTKRGNVFIAGDAACQTKFTGGGIVPSIESCIAVRDIILKKNYEKMNELNNEIFLHQMISRVLSKMNERDLDRLFEIAKRGNIKTSYSRDELRKWAVKVALGNPSLVRFIPKLFLP